MKCSPGECQNLITAAARGAGLSWGMAEEAGRAARWLIERQLLPPFSEVLSHRHNTPKETNNGVLISPAGGILCPIHVGVYLSDWARARPLPWTIATTAHPLIITPFAARIAALTQQHITIQWAGATMNTDGVYATSNGDLHAACAEIIICSSAAAPLIPHHNDECEIEDQEWRRLRSLAARSYVPATARSRQTGAGAGTSDND